MGTITKNHFKMQKLFLILFVLTLAYCKDLYRLNISTSDLTVSGISGGAFFAVQFGVAYSSLIKGVASFAGGPYYCAANNLMSAFDQCMYGTIPMDMNLNVEAAENFADESWIDPVSNVANQNIWIFSGQNDTVVAHSVGKYLVSFYDLLKSNVKAVMDIPAEHGWVTNDYGNDCGTLGTPFILKCTQLNAVEDMLTQIYSGLKTLAQPTNQNLSNLHSFDQSNFGNGTAGLQDSGYWYLPSACAAGHQCSLHVSFHGCKQSSDFVDETFVKHNELNGWAEANNIIVIYPQVATSEFYPYNPEGCFDWWGYTDTYYPTQQGPQMAAIRSMIKKVAGI
eukprot:TRINITY_DN1274_c0_g1_i3.p1 TRINITY_DN1274_c0_g1~~TRINITY_DN1274_c0_g1_i3.p1  ORF type:complete len:337 (+),score=50.28 TRINITY_DN1274_c0_g1_i3:128-1138(+)